MSDDRGTAGKQTKKAEIILSRLERKRERVKINTINTLNSQGEVLVTSPRRARG